MNSCRPFKSFSHSWSHGESPTPNSAFPCENLCEKNPPKSAKTWTLKLSLLRKLGNSGVLPENPRVRGDRDGRMSELTRHKNPLRHLSPSGFQSLLFASLPQGPQSRQKLRSGINSSRHSGLSSGSSSVDPCPPDFEKSSSEVDIAPL